MKKRFEGEDGRRLLVEALMEHKLVGGNIAVAREIADVGELIDVVPNTTLIEQGADDNSVYLILAGSFSIIVNGKRIAGRFANDHIGEMAAIQPTQRRSATVVSSDAATILRMTEPQLSSIGQRHPEIYRTLAKELARRLTQRNFLITSARDKVRVFIVSSAEALDIARGIQDCLEHDPFTVVIWTDGVFRASHYPVESLEKELDQSDFAIAIAQPDDIVQSRGGSSASPRDNVIFELGFFMGRLGRHRSLLLEPRGEEVKLPSDLSGITTIAYRHDPHNWASALGPACNRIRSIIRDLGPNN